MVVTKVGSRPVVQISLLGGVTADTDDGTPVDVGPAKCQTLLAALALSAGEAVPVSRLVDVVWGENPPRTAEKTLQGYVADLRKGLGRDAIARTGAAYRLQVDRDAVDVARFRRHVAAGDVDAALAGWSGSPLAGLDAPALGPAADGLVEQWLGALEVDLERRLSADAPAAVATLTQLTADHPFREGLWALLMTALYRSGRQADALAAYQRARTHLVDELGIEPGTRLRELEQLILAQDERLREPAPVPSVPTDCRQTGNLPRRPERLFGRDADVDIVLDALRKSPIVTLVGPGGIGKTVLARAAARRCQDNRGQRVWLVELGEIVTSEDVARAVASTLGVAERSAATLTDSVVAALGSRPTLLLLDNCEHVLDGAAVLARAVAEHAPDAQVLATSREAVGVAGERVVTVGPLEPGGTAAELFADRAGAVSASASFDLEGCRSTVAEICHRLDGLPLAIELAAARTRSMTPSQLLTRLDDRLRLLTSGRRAGADRHRTLRATVAWSYDLLSPAHRLLFQRLSVFAGPFDIAAAETVAAGRDLDAVEVDRLLDDLVERSMVSCETGPFARRFRLLETLRHFAAEQLTRDGGSAEVAGWHARWCRDQVGRISDQLTSQDEIEGVARLEELWPDLRAALYWACARGDAALADALVRPIAPEVNLRRQAEIGDWAERILELVRPDEEDMIVFWLAWAADRRVQTADQQAYERLVRRHGHTEHPLISYTYAGMYEDGDLTYAASTAAVAWLRERGAENAARLIEVAGVASGLMVTGRFAELDELATNMLQRYRASGPPTLLYFALGLLGYSAQFQGRNSAAARFFADASAVDVPTGTYLVTRTIEARTLFEHGQRTRGLRMLRDHVEALLDTDRVDVVRMVVIDFIPMMVALDQLAAAAKVLAYLDTTGGFGEIARDTLLAEEVRRITADPERTDGAVDLTARETLTFIRGVLSELTASPN